MYIENRRRDTGWALALFGRRNLWDSREDNAAEKINRKRMPCYLGMETKGYSVVYIRLREPVNYFFITSVRYVDSMPGWLFLSVNELNKRSKLEISLKVFAILRCINAKPDCQCLLPPEKS